MSFQYQATVSGERRIPGTDLRTRIRCSVTGTFGEVIRSVTETWGREGDKWNAPRQVTSDKVVATTERFPPYHTTDCAVAVEALALRVAGLERAPFATWDALLEHVRAGGEVYYGAPLDSRPVKVTIDRVYKNGKLRIAKPAHDVDAFTADSGHLPRFTRIAPKAA